MDARFPGFSVARFMESFYENLALFEPVFLFSLLCFFLKDRSWKTGDSS